MVHATRLEKIENKPSASLSPGCVAIISEIKPQDNHEDSVTHKRIHAVALTSDQFNGNHVCMKPKELSFSS